MNIGDVVLLAADDKSQTGIIVSTERHTFEDGWDGIERMEPFDEVTFIVVWADGTSTAMLKEELRQVPSSSSFNDSAPSPRPPQSS